MVTDQELEQERKNINRLKQAQREYMKKRAARYALLKEKIEINNLIKELNKDIWDGEID